jgi:leader peptidase (prepilin peptidase)/N-methyltransferase
METSLIIFWGVVGACIGSFVNVCVGRLINEQSLVSPPSHCDGCQRRLAWWELVPVLSYIILRGRCRTCGARIPLQVLWVEMGCGALLAFLYWSKGLTVGFGLAAFYSYVFIVLGLIDLRTKLILNIIVYPAALLALVLDLLLPGPGIVSGLIGAAVGFGFFLIPFLVTLGRGMGLGDAKMAALMGLALGFPLVGVGIVGGVVLGGVVAIFLLASGLKNRKEAIPFGPFLSLAGIVALIWGNGILQWYLGFFGR